MSEQFNGRMKKYERKRETHIYTERERAKRARMNLHRTKRKAQGRGEDRKSGYE